MAMILAVNSYPVALARTERLWQIPISSYFGQHSHLKGIMADIDGVVTRHNSKSVTEDIYHWFWMIYEVLDIPYCLTTWNIHR